ncbi:MAG TPA: electron transport complex protein RnfC [Firmicutes bacterium]|nr:electron transport complex protein RnfC [Bacillota bacterium]
MKLFELSQEEIITKVRAAGITGAGGASFPTYVKLQSKPDTYIANGAECEPLLHVSQELMARYPELVVKGLLACMRATAAEKGVIALKGKYKESLASLRAALARVGNEARQELPITIHELGDFYPAGDEHVLVYEVTGRRVPQGGIPIAVGVVVNNIETLINVARAVEEDLPVTSKWVTVCGAVKRPVTARFAIGTPMAKALELAGGPAVDRYVAIDGGPMMGKLVKDLSAPVAKSTGGLVVLPAENRWAELLSAPIEVSLKRARSHCIQCMNCTEMCPRYLLGHRLKPNRVMLEASYRELEAPHKFEMALACSECGLCEAYACPAGLTPRRVNATLKAELLRKGIRPSPVELREPDPARGFRKVPTSRLKARLGLDVYDHVPEFVEEEVVAEELTVLLKQHVGAAARPLVKQGDEVVTAQLIADLPSDKLGVPVHAPVSGVVTHVDDRAIRIRRGNG